MIVKAIESQSLLDIAIQECGSALSVFELAVENDLSLTEIIASGQNLNISKSNFEDKKITAAFSGKGLKIATISAGGFTPHLVFEISNDQESLTSRKSNCIAISDQSIFDIAIQELGTVKAVFELALANNISLTERIEPGQSLIIPTSKKYNQEVNEYFRFKGRKIATTTTEKNIYEYLFPNLFPLSI